MEPVPEEKLRRLELARFLRSRRSRISPQAVGLPERSRQRTPGLRREDVAELAAISLSWYSWLEQARSINVSDETLDAIATALQCDRDERQHLFALAKPRLGAAWGTPAAGVDFTEIARVLDSFSPDYPVVAVGRYLKLLTWNDSAGKLYDNFRVLPKERLNWVWFVFKYQSRGFFGDWQAFARCTLALLRSDYGRYLGVDPVGENLIAELRHEVPELGSLWSDHEVLSIPDPYKAFHHRSLGRLRYHTSTLTLETQPDVRIIVYQSAEMSA